MPYKWAVLVSLMPGMTVFLIDATVVNVALAKLGAVFAVDVATVQWAITAFALAAGVATPLASFMEDRFTMKRVWVVALTTFTASSALCGLAPAFWVLVLGRLLQGLSGGLMLPLATSTLFRAFPPGERGLALGFFAIPIVAGPALGPTVGGYIVTNWDWRYVFFVNLPVGIAAVLLALALLRPGEARPNARIDLYGVLLSSIGFGACLYGLSRVSQDGWDAFTVRGFIALGLVGLIAFVAYEWGRDAPLLDVRLFERPPFLVANTVGWVSTIALFGAEFMLPLYLQNLRGLTAVETGLMLLPQGLAVAVVGPIAGRLVDRIGARSVVVVGMSLLAFNTWQMSHLALDTPYDTLRWYLVVRGAALGCALQPTMLVALGVVPDRLRTNASSLTTAMRSVFQSFGVAMLSTVVQTQSAVHGAQLGWQVTPQAMQLGSPQLGAFVQAHGLPAAGGLLAILRAIRADAAVLAFGDAYRVTFFAAVVAMAAAFLLPGRGAVKVDPTALVGGEG